MSEDVTGNRMSMQALRTHPTILSWSVNFHLRKQYPERNVILVTFFNPNGNRVKDVYFVTRVQFVPIPSVNNWFYLRLYSLSATGAEQVVKNDTNSLSPLLLDSEILSEPRSAWFLRFNIQNILASRNSWSTDVGWQLLRYTNADSFFWQAMLVPDNGFDNPQPHIPVDADYDVARLLPNEAISSWECPICTENIAENGMLVCAHDPQIANGKHLPLHVFHKKCLDEWMVRKNTCPACRGALDPKPLPAVLSAGNFTLAARMGVNPYIVFKVSCVSCV